MDAAPSPPDALAHAARGDALYRDHAYAAAEAEYRAAVVAMPDRADVRNNLGAALLALGRTAEAEEAFREALRMRPEHVTALANLGTALAIQGYGAEPLRVFSRALALAPGRLPLFARAGQELLALGHFAAAERCFRLVLRERPEDANAVAGLARVLDRTGRRQEAFELLEPWIARGRHPANVAAAWARICIHLGRPALAVRPLERLLARALSAPEAAFAGFALGAAYDAMGEWERAFAAYSLANAKEGLPWNPDAFDARVDSIAATFDGPSFQRRPRAPRRGARSVFIVGMPRSGTTLVEQVLACHPEVHAAGEREELHLLTQRIARGLGAPWPGCFEAATAEEVRQVGAWYEARLGRESGDARVVTDKMPDNVLHLGLAAHALPRARVIRCVRDRADTCLSCFFQQFHHAHAWSTRLDWTFRRFDAVSRLCQHWDAVLPLPVLDVRYEDLVADPEPRIRAIVEFCGLPWDPACLRPQAAKRAVVTASYDQVDRPIYRDSVGRAERYRRWMEGG